MGGEKFDSPQPESFLFGENSGKYPPQFLFNIWPFFSLHLAKGSSLQLSRKCYFSKSFSGEVCIIVMNYFALSFNECFVKLKSFPLKNLRKKVQHGINILFFKKILSQYR
jgi:hypothetical protein